MVGRERQEREREVEGPQPSSRWTLLTCIGGYRDAPWDVLPRNQAAKQ